MSQPATVDDARDLVEAVLARLRVRGGRATSAWRRLLMALADSARHLSAEDLAARVRARQPDVNLSMIYRNLDRYGGSGLSGPTSVTARQPITWPRRRTGTWSAASASRCPRYPSSSSEAWPGGSAASTDSRLTRTSSP